MQPDDVEKLIADLKVKPSAELDARVYRAIDAARAERKANPSGKLLPELWSLIMKTRNTKWAATAAVLVALAGGLILLNKSVPSAFALERVIDAYNHVRFLHVKSFPAGQEEPKEFWIQSDPSGRVAKARYYLPVTQDGVKLITWTPERAELWFMSKRAFATLQTKRIQPWMQSLLEQSQPLLVVKNLADAKKAGQLDIEVQDARDPHQPVRMTVVHKTRPDKDVYYIDQETHLITRIEFYHLGSSGEVLTSRTEFCDYNVAIDDKMFSLQPDLPKDVRIADQLSQVIGVAQGNMTDEQAAVETVRQFFQALVDKDYKTAGRIQCGLLEAYAKADFGKLKVASILSLGPAVLQTNWEKRGYRVPCELAITYADGEKGVWKPGPYVRPGDDESHPDNWNITGGVSASDAELRILPDNETYEKMTPKEAAQAFLKACAESNWDEFFKFWSMSWPASDKRFKRMQEYLGGLKVISLGEPFRTNTYAGW